MLEANVRPVLQEPSVLQGPRHAQIVRQIKYLLLEPDRALPVPMDKEPHQFVLEFVRMI